MSIDRNFALLALKAFLSTHAAVYNLFNLGRHLVSAENYRYFRLRAFACWEKAAALQNAYRGGFCQFCELTCQYHRINSDRYIYCCNKRGRLANLINKLICPYFSSASNTESSQGRIANINPELNRDLTGSLESSC